MKNRYLAKSFPTETIPIHTDKLYYRALKLKELYGDKIKYVDWDMLLLACIYHDLGKMNSKFQNKLLKVLKHLGLDDIELLPDNSGVEYEIPHNYLSCYFVPRNYIENELSEQGLNEDEIFDKLKMLYQMIYYGHNRQKLKNEKDVLKIIESELQKYYDEFSYDKIPCKEPLTKTIWEYIADRISFNTFDIDDVSEEGLYDLERVIRCIVNKGLLNKLDYAASSDTPIEIENIGLGANVLDWFSRGGYTLNDLQQYFYDNKNYNIIAIASTGTGKTEAGFLWIDDGKGFFILPLKVAINAIYKRLTSSDSINFPKDRAALLHSDILSEYLKNNASDNNNNVVIDETQINMAKQLSMAVTVCTLDQLIDFIFKYEGYEVKLATLSYSKIIIDEIQMFSPKLIAFLIVGLKYINMAGGKFAILTATLPPIFEHFIIKELGADSYKKPPQPFIKKDKHGNSMIRHVVTTKQQKLTSSEILNVYNNNKVLVICNTVTKAQLLYDEVKAADVEDVFLFHSKYTKKHRAIKETQILDFAPPNHSNNKKGIWITTQVVEASLDIDFDFLLTELSDLCGFFQRNGRVYRSRVYTSKLANIHLYVGAELGDVSGIDVNRGKGIIDADIHRLSREKTLDWNNTVLTEELKMELIEEVYSVENLKSSEYYQEIKKTIHNVKNIEDYSISKSDIDLREIDSATIIPEVCYNDNLAEINESLVILQNENVSKEAKVLAKERILSETLSINSWQLKAYSKKNCIIGYVNISKYNKIPIVRCKYSFDKGLEI